MNVSPLHSIRRLAIANRGEPVVRIARTCRSRGVTPIALVTEDQDGDWWQQPEQVDARVRLHGTYLDPEAVLDAARRARADAIHPGWGYLAENAGFARAVEAGGMVWVGPPPEAMERLGDKAAARRLAAALGLPMLQGYDGEDQSDERLAAEAERIGFPVLVKPSGGGGGKGMHVVREAAELEATLGRARREAKAAFADERLILERYLERPRHVEIQVLFDRHGNGVHLGERDCSLQRRHQKVIEEGPSPGVDESLRGRLGETALRLAATGGYVGAGTVEFLLDGDGAFFFMEMNTRLQVEHPVTELLTGRDLVADQLRVASGEELGFTQDDVRLEGHAIEARIYAEDPWNDFLPTSGLVDPTWPDAEGIRVDAGVGALEEIGTRYDPMLAKVIAHAHDRDTAITRLDAALEATRLEGLTSNRGFLRALLATDEYRRGDARTDTIALRWRPSPDVPDEAWQRAALHLAIALGPARAGFRLNAPPSLRLRAGGDERTVRLRWEGVDPPLWVAADEPEVTLDVDGRSLRFELALPPTVESAIEHAAAAAGGGAARVTAPMPGVVLAVHVVEGDEVEAHQALVTVEAMKMENVVVAPAAGTVRAVRVQAGQSVQRGEILLELG